MNEPLEQIDEVISRKRQELKNLLFARDALSQLQQGTNGLAAIPVHVGSLMELTTGKSKQTAEDNSPKRRKAGKAARLESIKKLAGGIPKLKPGGKGQRRKFTVEQKLAILKEFKAAPLKKTVLKKYALANSVVCTWLKKEEAGDLNPSGGEADVSSISLSSDSGDDEVMFQGERGSDEDVAELNEDGGDLLSEMAGSEVRSEEDPFVMGEGKVPNFDSPM